MLEAAVLFFTCVTQLLVCSELRDSVLELSASSVHQIGPLVRSSLSILMYFIKYRYNIASQNIAILCNIDGVFFYF